jgi:hypothetical protein
MKKWFKITKWKIGCIGATSIIIATSLLLLVAPHKERDNRNTAKQNEMEQITLEWARLAPFPQKAKNFNIYTEGSAFTRTFKGSFNCSEDEMESWVELSPGLQDAEIEDMSDTIKKYIISPGGGANYAEVVIDYAIGSVEFKVSWS